MSHLIDNFLEAKAYYEGKYYIAKPYCKDKLTKRIKEALQVLSGKAIAIHFKIDENEL